MVRVKQHFWCSMWVISELPISFRSARAQSDSSGPSYISTEAQLVTRLQKCSSEPENLTIRPEKLLSGPNGA